MKSSRSTVNTQPGIRSGRSGMQPQPTAKGTKSTGIDDASRIVDTATSLGSSAFGTHRSATRSDSVGNRAFATGDSFNMTPLSASLSEVHEQGRENARGNSTSTMFSSSAMPASDEAEEWQLQIGYSGELFVFNYLKTAF
ncbi:hypothetical protein LTR08_008177 [Meristemomyces frigidus]|nr:hypothetical protein LTR08_008177 [Meristemomyces frigidus]